MGLLSCASMMVAGILAIGAAQAAEPSLTVNGAAAAGGLSTGVQSVLNAARGAAANAAAGTGPTIYVDPAIAVEATQGFGGLSAADQSFAKAMAGAYDLYKAVGGSGTDRQSVIQRKDGMYYVGLDGEGGRWFASADQALSFLFNNLVAKDEKISPKAKSAALTCAQDILCAVLAIASDRYATIATVARGSTVGVTITGNGFSNTGGTPVVAASDGILTQSVTYVSSEKLTAVMQVLPSARLGDNMVAVFNPGRGYQNSGAYKLVVIDGNGAAPASDNATRATAAALALPATVSGKIVDGSAEQFFKINVSQAGTLTLSSTGGSDVKGTLEDSTGQSLATSEDDGTWYNFKLSRAVQPGTYYLRVGHCCGGIGAYQINAAIAP
ncbi:MAG: PPC domain-containing protein [Alphaproteobacteria bacterium]|nr:PPC domain-containing protein [Alphaproteobacteria bacterium]